MKTNHWVRILIFMMLAVAGYQLAGMAEWSHGFILVYLWALVNLAFSSSARAAFYSALLVGSINAAIQLFFFWRIFGPAAIPLWLILGFWLGLFCSVGYSVLRQFGKRWGLFLLPFVWTGLEYFRSELYYLKFSWLNETYLFSGRLPPNLIPILGMYGWAFCLMSVVCVFMHAKVTWLRGLIAVIAISLCLGLKLETTGDSNANRGLSSVKVAGIQMEFPGANEIKFALEKLVKSAPDAELLVLSEYTLDGEPSQNLKDWCRNKRKYLIVGGKDGVEGNNYFNTVFVIGNDGNVQFKQAKSVPIQFFKDGIPARRQEVWNSPWGKIGLCICYDLSYTRVTDELIRQGARALIVPTMDVVEWGGYQHRLHSWVAPVRAAEYGVPIFRVASSGISQLVDGHGKVLSTAPMPGEEAMLSGVLRLEADGKFPLDRWLAPACVWVVVGLLVFLWCDPLITRGSIHIKSIDK